MMFPEPPVAPTDPFLLPAKTRPCQPASFGRATRCPFTLPRTRSEGGQTCPDPTTAPETGRLTERGPNSLGRRHLFLKTKRLEVIGRSGAGAGVRLKGPEPCSPS